MTTIALPRIYRNGLPLYWMDETSGQLADAVRAFLAHGCGAPPPSVAQLELVRAYLEYVIHAPCWRVPDGAPELTELRHTIAQCSDVASINRWLDVCLEIGIDPL